VDGCVDASQVSRVYPASTLPGDLLVPGLGLDGSRSGVMLPLGHTATEALRLRCVQVMVLQLCWSEPSLRSMAWQHIPVLGTNPRWVSVGSMA
jgi:hypothetical protein